MWHLLTSAVYDATANPAYGPLMRSRFCRWLFYPSKQASQSDEQAHPSLLKYSDTLYHVNRTAANHALGDKPSARAGRLLMESIVEPGAMRAACAVFS